MNHMKAMTTMTNHKIRRPSRSGHSAADKVVSASLAVAACAGLVGVIAVRTTQEAQASDAQATTEVTDASLVAATTSAGLTQAQLDEYAAQLEAERLKLIDYRDQLALAAAAINGAVQQTGVPSAKAGAALKTPTAKSGKAKAKAQVTAPGQQQAQALPPLQAAPQAKAAPRPQAQVQQQQAPRPQAQTKSS
jgi:rhodanese-related sulfurtransferase